MGKHAMMVAHANKSRCNSTNNPQSKDSIACHHNINLSLQGGPKKQCCQRRTRVNISLKHSASAHCMAEGCHHSAIATAAHTTQMEQFPRSPKLGSEGGLQVGYRTCAFTAIAKQKNNITVHVLSFCRNTCACGQTEVRLVQIDCCCSVDA